MNDNAHDKAALEEHFADVFARLHEQDIEQFYAHYQLWVLRRRLPLIENQLEALREHLAENQQVIESLRPSALALAVLVRLQSNGVSDTDVLDLMLDRGEDWLDCMMQRLDYCEQVEDFIQGDYTQWCIKSLEGAYDWIDSLLGSIKEDDGHRESPGRDDEATEALLLQKLRQDDEEAMMEVTLEQPAVATESHETSAADALPASEHELTTLPNEQVSALDENSETPGQPELLLQSDEAAEPQESSELEQQSELIGWKDLEDLEAPGEEPVPWYSIDVTEDGATSAPNGARQAATMNDWITILQADSVASNEASRTEAATDLAAEPLTSTDLAETAETQAPMITPDRAVTETPANHVEMAEPETFSPANTDQEQPISASEKPQTEEISSGESEILVDDTPATEINLAEKASLFDENLAMESTNDESKPLVDGSRLDQVAETSYDAHKANEVTISAEKAEEEAEQSASERANRLEEPEQAASEQENNASKQQEESREEAPTLAEKAVTGIDEAESYQAQPSVGDLQQAGVEEAETAEVRSFAANVEQTEAAETETPPLDLALTESAPAELSEGQISTEETAQTRDEQTESPKPQAEEIQEADPTPETEKEARGNEIETAAIVNDILSGEEGQEEQLAWYEYLDLEESANNVVNSTAEEHIEPENAGDSIPDEPVASGTASSETAEYAIVEESGNEQNSVPHPESKITEEAVEIENWQSWNASEADEETLPLALKEIQRAQQPLVNNTPESVARVDSTSPEEAEAAPLVSNTPESVASEMIEPQDESENEDAETHAPGTIMEDSSAAVQKAHTEIEASAVAEDANMKVSSAKAQAAHTEVKASAITEDVNTKSEEHPASKAADITEQPTLIIESAPHAQAATLQEKPPKKLGFWRRLFSFGRKKKK